MQGIFDITSLKPGSRIAIVGKRGCGSTTLAKDIIEAFRQKKHRAVVLCNYPDEYSDTIGYENCFTGNPVGVIQSLKKLPNNERILFVSDEYCYTNEDWSNGTLEWLFNSEQNKNVTSVFCLQTFESVPPKYRMEFDYVFEYNEPNEKSVHGLIALTYIPIKRTFPKKELFTSNYKCIVKDFTGSSNIDRYDNQPAAVYYYKARV